MMKLFASCLTVVLVAGSTAGAQTIVRPGEGQPQRPAARNSSTDYIVGAQDVLKVTVFEEPSMSGVFRVDNDGSFQYPMLGRVAAAGLRLRDIEQALKTKLEDGYINRAQVAVDVEQFRSRSIFVVGEVRSPGKYPMAGQMTLIEALAAAGSTTPNASTEVLILRPRDTNAAQPLTPDQANQANVSRVSLADLQLGRLSENVSLMEGDTIFVPKADKFFITGQVKTPGAYTYERGLTVLQAISLAGGLTDKGSNRRLKAIRVVKGKKMEVKVDLTDTIEPGDTLMIPQRLL
jgi:polysaccharide biosynthesis/export protein